MRASYLDFSMAISPNAYIWTELRLQIWVRWMRLYNKHVSHLSVLDFTQNNEESYGCGCY